MDRSTAEGQARRTRRRFLGEVGATALASGAAIGSVAPSAQAKHHGRRGARIDVHSHWVPDAYKAYTQTNGQTQWPWSFEEHLAFQARYGIDASVVSISSPGPTLGTPDDARVAREINDAGAQLIRDHGDRFGVYGALPLPDIPAAAAEAEYVLDQLKLDGLGVYTNYAAVYHGHPSFDPLYEVLDDREAVVFCHPTTPAPTPRPNADSVYDPFYLNLTTEFVFDTTRTVGNLIYSGAARRYPRIRWIFCHAGGTLPFVGFRVAAVHSVATALNDVAPEGPLPHLKRFYYETAQAYGVAQMRAATETFDVSQLMLGTDWPIISAFFSDRVDQLVPLPASWLPGEGSGNGDPAPLLDRVFGPRERRLVDRENALDLFPGLAARLRRRP